MMRFRFSSLQISDFRGTRELDVRFEPDLTVIVGRNGAGKTSILDALAMTVGYACSRATEMYPGSFGVGPWARHVHAGAASSKLAVQCEFAADQSAEPSTEALTLKIDRDLGAFELPFRKNGAILGMLPALRLQPKGPGTIYYPQARGFECADADFSASANGTATVANTAMISSDFPASANRASTAPAMPFSPGVWSINGIMDSSRPGAARNRLPQTGLPVIGDLEAWWDQRDAQEARRVRDGESSYHDPQLAAIRELVGSIDGFSHVAFDADASPSGLHFVKDDGTPVHVSGLSAGERSYLVLLADLARRLQVFAPGKPLGEISAIVLIDEIELNLHPGWQSEIVPTLAKVFQGCQFVLTTHSPQVLSGVSSEKVRIIEEDGKVTVPLSTRGRTSNYLLEGVLGARERFPEIDRQIEEFNSAIDKENAAQAEAALQTIEREVEDDTATLLVLRKRLKKLRDGA